MNTTTTLTPSQQQAIEQLHQFLTSSDKEFCLIGAAGSGKSFTINHFCRTWLDVYTKHCKKNAIKPIYQDLYLTATTNKAASLLDSQEHPATTIHKLLGLGVHEDRSTGDVGLKLSRLKGPIENAIIVVDEASMVNWQLHKHIYERTTNCKIIYVGDASQLPPVRAIGSLPLVFIQGFPEARLTEDVRQKNAPKLLHLCHQLRDIVATGDTKIELPTHCEVHWLSPSEVKPILDSHFKEPTTQDKILTYTNERCKQYSDHIVSLQYPQEPLNPQLGNFIVGERVMCNEAYSTIDGTIYTGQELTIKQLRPAIATYDGSSIAVVQCQFCCTDVVGLIPTDIEFYQDLLKYYKKSKNWECYFKLKNKMLDIIRPYSLTIHKSQGSTYPTVFVDMDDALSCTGHVVKRRLLYVAVSRASQQLYLFGTEATKKKFLG